MNNNTDTYLDKLADILDSKRNLKIPESHWKEVRPIIEKKGMRLSKDNSISYVDLHTQFTI